MPLLSGLLVTLFGSLLGFFVKFLAVRGAAVAAALATFAILWAAVFAAAAAASATITTAFPAIALTGVWLLVPDNAPACLAAILAIDTAALMYKWNYTGLQLATRTAM